MSEYVAVTEEEAQELGYPPPWGDEWPEGDEWFVLYVYDLTEDKPRCIGCDGGEPEDQTLDRAWSWVVPELVKAYRKGYKHGADDSWW